MVFTIVISTLLQLLKVDSNQIYCLILHGSGCYLLFPGWYVLICFARVWISLVKCSWFALKLLLDFINDALSCHFGNLKLICYYHCIQLYIWLYLIFSVQIVLHLLLGNSKQLHEYFVVDPSMIFLVWEQCFLLSLFAESALHYLLPFFLKLQRSWCGYFTQIMVVL